MNFTPGFDPNNYWSLAASGPPTCWRQKATALLTASLATPAGAGCSQPVAKNHFYEDVQERMAGKPEKPRRTLALQADIFSSEAKYSPCKRYRYWLTRRWGQGNSGFAFVGLNPSTATETVDDPTVRRCINFARDWGGDFMVMLNVFALRSTDPKGLYSEPNPVGEETNHWLLHWAEQGVPLVAAWGNHGAHMERGKQVNSLFKEKELLCLGRTASGQPKHPLYLRKDLKPQPY